MPQTQASRRLKTTCLLLMVAAFPLASIQLLPVAFARGHFDKATAEPAQDNLKQGLQLMRVGNYEAAIDSFMQSVYFSRNHYNPEAYKWLGLCYKATRQYPKAVEAFKSHLSQTTEPAPDVHIDLAETYLDMKEFDKAREEIDKAYIDQTQTSGTWRQKYAMAELYERMDQLGPAHQFYMAALEEKPLYTEAWMGKARMEVKMKEWNDALKDYRAMLEKTPLLRNVNMVEVYYNMGTCFFQRGDHQGALDNWRLALEQNPDHYDSHLALAAMFDQEKHISSAIHEYQAALRTMPPGAGQKATISRRLQWLEQQIAPKEALPEIKPSPAMRQEYEDALRQRDAMDKNSTPPSKDSGF